MIAPIHSLDSWDVVPVSGASGLRGLAFDNYGTIWIASSSNGAENWNNL